MEKNKLESLQALRGIAALMVVFYHFFSCFNINSKLDIANINKAAFPIAHILWGKGYCAVDLFFVLSGFIIFYSLKTYDVKRFIIHRISKIYPAFIIAMICALVFLEPQLISQDKVVLLKQLLFIPTGTHPPLYTHAIVLTVWTLNYEMYFYLVIALMLLLFSKNWFRATNCYFIATIIILPLSLFGQITLSGNGYKSSNFGLKLITNPILYEFWMGLWLGYVLYFKKVKFDKVFNLLATPLFVAIVLCYLFLPDLKVKYGLTAMGFGAFIIVAIMIYQDLNPVKVGIRMPKLLSSIGNMSYSLYIWHTFVLEVMYKIFYKNVPRLKAEHNIIYYRGDPGMKFLLLYLVITFILSYVSYKVIETYLSNKLRQLFG
jgi:exopolysaccharide production protein ExoZ